MKKIEFDTVTGVHEVEDFAEETDRVDSGTRFEMVDIFGYLREDFEGTRGAEVDIKTFRMIDAEYGVKKLKSSTSEAGRKGGKSKSEGKAAAVRENGKLGGRPRKAPAEGAES